MCAVLDANVASEVFGADQPPAGKGFFDWINSGGGRLVVGGRLRGELRASSGGFRKWAAQAQRYGRIRLKDDDEVDARTEALQGEAALMSDDPHIIALAQVSGARLLYSNDRALQQDFRNRDLISNPRGSVYSTLGDKNFTRSRKKQLVSRSKLCQSDQ